MITTKKLLSRIDSNLNGCYHFDGTYKLVKNGFPLIVLSRTDAVHRVHPIAFCLTSHEQEIDFTNFYEGLITLSDDLDIEFDPEYIVQDAWDASYNAATNLFENVSILMCYFHVMKNCKDIYKQYPQPKQKIIKKYIRKLHMSTSGTDLTRNLATFKDYAVNVDECRSLYYYLKRSWLKGNY